MGTVRKIGAEYFIEFEARGLKYQQKAGPDEPSAWKLLAEIEGKIRQGEMGIAVRDIHVIAFLDDFLTEAAKLYPERSVKRLRATIKHFKIFLQHEFPQLEFLSQVTPKIVESYKVYLRQMSRPDGRTRKDKLTNLTLLLMREVFAYGIKLGFLNDNPGLHVHFLPHSEERIAIMKDEDLAAVLAAAPTPLAQIAKIILVTGLHPQEVCHLRWAEVNGEANVIYAGKELSEGRQFFRREIPLVPVVRTILTDLEKPGLAAFLFRKPDGTSLSWSELDKEWQDCCQYVGIEQTYHLMDLRHIFASQASVRGVSLLRLSMILGYSDVAGIVKYIGFIPDIHERFQKG